MRFSIRFRKAVAIPVALLVGGGAAAFFAGQATATPPQLVYICTATPCTNAQEFAVFDANGAPIYSVGEFGGDGVFGDNRSVFAPGTVVNPAVVNSYTDPATYDSTHGRPSTCVPPVVWLEPHGLWHCVGTHWAKVAGF
jgi:hypothetical protein